MQRLQGRTAVVTGAAVGIGAAIARRLLDDGARVVLADIDPAVADVGAALGGDTLAMTTDVTDSDQVAAMVAAGVERFGSLDILCNNAGTESAHVPMTECPPEEFDRVVAVNLRGVFLGMKHGLSVMTAQGSGSVINISSLLANRALPTQGAYASSKAGVLALTRVAAWEVGASNVRVNAICPGGVLTDLAARVFAERPGARAGFEQKHALGRLAQPDEIAAVVAFLASDDASFITGASIDVDGGWGSTA